MQKEEIIIIGAGIAGLSCAAHLQRAGLKPLILDKGRGIGGRLATRRAQHDLQFDHGAQYVTAKTAPFQSVLEEASRSGNVALWNDEEQNRYVGAPGMNGLAKYISQNLNVRQNVEVTDITKVSSGYELYSSEHSFSCSKLIATAPEPQTSILMKPLGLFADELANVQMQPCLTLMAAFNSSKQPPFISRRDAEDSLSWIALDSSKPLRETKNCWVAQASAEWSARYLEKTPEAIVKKMLPLLCDQIVVSPEDTIHAVVHRWRYAAVSKPLGRSFLKSPDGSLYLGGDWCLGARVESAWTSGSAIAGNILSKI